MRYYLIVGEASGDLHASHLMRCLKEQDPAAQFRFFGGDLMTEVGGVEARVRHFRELAYMGFIPVLLHLPTIFRNMALCKRDVVAWQPDVVILVDYAGFNLNIAKFLKSKTKIPAFYYISPKLWAWKEWRIKSIKRDVAHLFSILPFEVDFFEHRHNYPIHYVGNPTADEVRLFCSSYQETREAFCLSHGLDTNKPIVALLAGSRKQEIKSNLPAMLQVAAMHSESHQFVIAGAPSVPDDFYDEVIAGVGGVFAEVKRVNNVTYPLLFHASAALVTSGTATLETALFGVPQVVCYQTPLPHLIRFAFNHIIRCRYISLVNLIAGYEVVPEMMAERFSVSQIDAELTPLLSETPARQQMLAGYTAVQRALGDSCAPEQAAREMVALLRL